MHVTSHLSVDMVALDEADEVTVLLSLTAPDAPLAAERPGRSLILLIDRSGSMDGAPLDGAKDAVRRLVRRLAPHDCFGIVAFDDEASVVVPADRMADHDERDLAAAIDDLEAGGQTDLSSGYLLALREAKRVIASSGHAGATIVLLSDGHANGGITDPVRLRSLAAKAQLAGVTTSTLGLGLGYDEDLLQAITAGGNGQHCFAPDVDSAVIELERTVTDLLDVSVLAATVRITPSGPEVDGIRVRHDLPTWQQQGSVVVSIGDLHAGEERKILVTLDTPAVGQLGTATVATIELSYTTAADLREHRIELPVCVNVVPGDEARGRVPSPVVVVEALIASAHEAKRGIAESLRSQDTASARDALDAEGLRLQNCLATMEERDAVDRYEFAACSAMVAELQSDLVALSRLVDDSPVDHAAKAVVESMSAGTRGRRLRRGGAAG